MYESSIFCGFDAGAAAAGSDLATITEGDGCGALVTLACWVLAFSLGTADSLFTRTDAGTIAVSSGVCCASGLLTTVDAADLT